MVYAKAYPSLRSKLNLLLIGRLIVSAPGFWENAAQSSSVAAIACEIINPTGKIPIIELCKKALLIISNTLWKIPPKALLNGSALPLALRGQNLFAVEFAFAPNGLTTDHSP